MWSDWEYRVPGSSDVTPVIDLEANIGCVGALLTSEGLRAYPGHLPTCGAHVLDRII